MKDPPVQARGRVGEYCQNKSGLTTASFANNLEKGGTAQAGGDPVTCSQNPPESLTVVMDPQIGDNRATAGVSEKFGSIQVAIRVELLRENTVWKVDNIACPKPS